MTRILHRQIGGDLPVAIGGKGVHLFDRDGRSYIDASGGAAVSCLGHGHPDVSAAIHAQADRLAYAHTSFFTNDPAEELADRLIAEAPQGISHAYFVSGGSRRSKPRSRWRGSISSNWGSTATQYHRPTPELPRQHAGRARGRRQRGAPRPVPPLLIETHHIAPCFAYRFQQPGETAESYAARAAQELEDKILALGAETVIAFVAEPVVGATAGAVPPVADYFARIRSICDRYGILLILDEVMCGMGRTGTLHASEQDGIAPDLMTVAKGLGGGYQPIGAVLLGERIFNAFANGTGAFQHGHTYICHPMACAAALAVQKVIARDHLLANVKAMGAQLSRRLGDRFGNHAHVGDIRGRGLLMGVELVEDRSTRAPFDPKLKLHARVKREAMARGLCVYPGGGTIDGMRGDHVLIAPPFIVDAAVIDQVVERLGDAIDAAIQSGR